MADQVVYAIVSHGIALLVGLAIGEFIGWRRRKGGKLVIEVEAKEVWMKVVRKVAWVSVVVIFFATVAQSVIFTYEQRQCNMRVVNTLNYRASLADSDRHLLDLRDSLLDQRDEATFKMVTSLLALPQVVSVPHVPGSGTGPPATGVDREASRAVLEQFVSERARIDAEMDKVSAEADKVDAMRRANPLPYCGG